MSSSTPHLILASASPRRRELLAEAGFDFVVEPADIDESAASSSLAPAELALHLALAKAQAVAARHGDDVTLAADTIVARGSQCLGKPTNADAARAMLRLLSGTTHSVITGIAVIHPSAKFSMSRAIISMVRMRSLGVTEIDRYISDGGWQGKAGGYGIQDHDPFVTCTSGSHSNIVGLPLEATVALLALAGIVPRL